MGQEDGVAEAVGQVVEAAELVGHGVNVAEAGVIECHAGKILSVAHTFAGFLIVAVGHGAAQEAVDVFDGLFGAGVGHGSGGNGNIGFHGVGQGVHAGGGGEAGGHAHHEVGVVDGDAGGAAPVHDSHLHLAGSVGDDAEAGHFRSGAGSGVHGNVGREGILGLVHAFVVVDLAAVGNEEADALAAVVGAAAAEGEEAVATLFLIDGKGFFHVLIGGIRNGLVVDGVLDVSGVKDIGDGLQNTAGNDALVSNDEGIFSVAAGKTVGDLLAAARANERNGRDIERSDLADVEILDVAHGSIPLLLRLCGY